MVKNTAALKIFRMPPASLQRLDSWLSWSRSLRPVNLSPERQ
jgi:hypothetical protein